MDHPPDPNLTRGLFCKLTLTLPGHRRHYQKPAPANFNTQTRTKQTFGDQHRPERYQT